MADLDPYTNDGFIHLLKGRAEKDKEKREAEFIKASKLPSIMPNVKRSALLEFIQSEVWSKKITDPKYLTAALELVETGPLTDIEADHVCSILLKHRRQHEIERVLMEAEIEDSRRDHYLLMTYLALKKPALFLDVYEQTNDENQKAFGEHVPEQLEQLSARIGQLSGNE